MNVGLISCDDQTIREFKQQVSWVLAAQVFQPILSYKRVLTLSW